MYANRSTSHAITSCYDARVLSAFEHSHECEQLSYQGVEPRYLPCLLELAESLWMTPDDITGPLLLELLHDLPRVRDYQSVQISDIVNELTAFWSFVGRECQYPHAEGCLRVLDRDAALALECALQCANAISWQESTRW
jgi:hypothetical protein